VTQPAPQAISINDAAQVLRPPEDGLPYLRHDRARELTVAPGSLRTQADLIAGFEPAAEAAIQIDARECAVVPGFVDCHTHLPFAGWREREYAMKIAG
jgi:imidazolonepropionase